MVEEKLETAQVELQKEDEILVTIYTKWLDAEEWGEEDYGMYTIDDSINALFDVLIDPRSLMIGKTVNWSQWGTV